jgi:hypothetical protein
LVGAVALYTFVIGFFGFFYSRAVCMST